jgi:hypothetical protein
VQGVPGLELAFFAVFITLGLLISLNVKAKKIIDIISRAHYLHFPAIYLICRYVQYVLYMYIGGK